MSTGTGFSGTVSQSSGSQNGGGFEVLSGPPEGFSSEFEVLSGLPPGPGDLNAVLTSPEFKQLDTKQRVQRLKSWVDDSVDYAKMVDPSFGVQQEQDFRSQFVDREG